jgi:hypothetical protein
MKKVLGISLLLVVALTAMAFGKPVTQSNTRLLPEVPNLEGEQTTSSSVSGLSLNLFGPDTISYGGTWWASDSSRWEAVRDSCWTFQTGIGSSIDNGTNPNKPDGYHQTMEGWFGLDQTLNPLPYFRSSSVVVISGGFSLWAGVSTAEANALCYAGGQGYGNAWTMFVCKTFVYGGGNVNLTYDYQVECEPGFDYSYVVVDTTGSTDPTTYNTTGIILATYTGSISGSENFNLVSGVSLPSAAGSFSIWLVVTSDGSYSDEDALYPTANGHSAFDNINLTGGATDAADFEGGSLDGWAAITPTTGVGDFTNLVSRSDLPPPAVFCPCAVQDTVLVFYDLLGGHPLDQDNLAVSPWIDLRRNGDVGRPIKLMLYSVYAVMPIINYIFVQLRARFYPDLCDLTGLIFRTPFRDQNIVFYFGESPFCTAVGATQLRDYSAVIEPQAEQVQLAMGMISLCRTSPFAPPVCNGVTNTTPWMDNCALGVSGPNTAPGLTYLTFDVLQDSFAEDGTLNMASTGRFDGNTVKDAANPIPGSHLRDSTVVRGDGGNVEVRFYFSIIPGPYTNPVALANRATRWTPVIGLPGWYCVRIDTAEQGGIASVGNWMANHHELDPGFVGSDTSIDPNEQDGNRLENEVLPDRLFTPGTRISYFFCARYIPPDPRNVGGVNWFTLPDTTGANYLEVEILPSSVDTTGPTDDWNCYLLVDHHDDRSLQEQQLEEEGMQAYLTGGGTNPEGHGYDRFDNETPSSGQLSFGRSIRTNYGCSNIQVFAYKVISWHAATLSSLVLTGTDASVVRPWLQLPAVGGNAFYGSGDGFVRSMATSGDPSSIAFMVNALGVAAGCNTVRDPNCPNPSGLDSTSCIPIVSLGGAHFSNTVATSAQGNGCNALRSFDVQARQTGVLGTLGQSDFVKGGVNTSTIQANRHMSVSRYNTLDVSYKTVIDGAAVGSMRTTTGTPNNLALCAANTGAAISRHVDILTWFNSAAVCVVPAGIIDVPGEIPGPKPPQFRHALGNAYPNPMNPTTRIQFSNGVANGRVTVQIFDVTGRLVKSLLDEKMPAGVHEVTWDGTSDSGSPIPSGMYFYRMTGEKGDGQASYVASKKLVVVQ